MKNLIVLPAHVQLVVIIVSQNLPAIVGLFGLLAF